MLAIHVPRLLNSHLSLLNTHEPALESAEFHGSLARIRALHVRRKLVPSFKRAIYPVIRVYRVGLEHIPFSGPLADLIVGDDLLWVLTSLLPDTAKQVLRAHLLAVGTLTTETILLKPPRNTCA